jgi:transcriptional regulator with XRE-family HTH domain
MADIDGSLGEVVRSARVGVGSSLRDLAKKLEIAPSYLSDIENDRRVPSEDVLARLAAELDLKVDDLMARAGRFGHETERYVKQHPTAGVLFRRISSKRLPDADLKKLLTAVDKMGTKKGG